MVRRIFAIVLIVLGLGTIGAAIASGTIWRPDDRVTLTLPAAPDVPLVITAPGVLDAVDDVVDVHLVGASEDTPIVLAMARESDVLAWVGDAPHWEITGLTDWDTLSYVDSRDEAGTATPTDGGTETPSQTPSAEETESTEAPTDEPTEEGTDAEVADQEPQTVPDPSGSDLWIEEVSGTGELDYSWTAVPGRWVMLVASDGTAPAPQVELTWDRPVETPFVRPGVILGSVVLLLGLGLLTLQILSDLERRRARRAAALASTAETSPVLVADGDRPLTRREIRLAEQARKRGGKPAVPAAQEPESAVTPAVAEQDPAPSATSPETDDAAADEAGELDAWVRSGAASPLMHEGEPTTPADLEVAPDEVSAGSGDEPAEEAAPSSEEEPRGSWWRRRGSRKTAAPEQHEPEGSEAEHGAVEPVDEPEPSRDPAAGDTDQIPVVEAESESDPQEWGAEWRQTWGLTTDGQTEPKEEDR